MNERLLDGMPYTNSVQTDVAATFRKYGFVPPSELRKQQEREHVSELATTRGNGTGAIRA
jgi:hypothetical protein